MGVMFGVTPSHNLKKSIIKSSERLTLRYYAPMWKTTPTASMQVILNQKPSHIEIKGDRN